MSGIARVLAGRGVEVSGCDRSTAAAAELTAAGVPCLVGHDPAHLRPGMRIGRSTAVAEDEPELAAARRAGLEIRHRSELLAEIVATGRGICVAGAHGKTTTSAMLAFVLEELGERPTFVIGGEVPQLGANARAGSGALVVAEADESDGSLAVLRPACAIVLNVELDHHDHFPSLEALVELLGRWTRTLPADGLLVCGDGVELPTAAPVRRAGTGPGPGWRALEPAPAGRAVAFTLAPPGGGRRRVQLSVPGVHNAANAAAALAALDWAGVPPSDAVPALERFRGAGRRFDVLGEARGVRVVDDYAHHPTELEATLAAARTYADGGRVLACFQPHMPWRTRALQRGFATALAAADAACVCDVYIARGDAEEGVSGKLVVDRLAELAPDRPLAWTPSYDDAASWLLARARPGDLIVTMGAGPVDRVAALVLEALA